MVDAGVPGSMEELVERYDRQITWAIHRASRRSLDDDTVQELRQRVYLRIMQSDFLGRCRAYYDGREGRFTTSLTRLVRNLVYGRFSATKTDPLNPRTAISEADFDPTIPSHEHGIEARDVLAALGRRLDPPGSRHTIRGADLLDAALTHGFHSKTLGTVLGANPSTVRFHIHRVRREARRMAEGSWRTATTKSARSSAAHRSPSGAASAPPTASA